MAKPKSSRNNHLAYITPSVLTWALDRSGESRDAISRRLKVKPEDLERWESGVAIPFKRAEKLANDLRVPFGLLFLSEPPDLNIKLPDMRRLPMNYRQSPNFIELVHDALLRQDWYRDLMRSTDEEALPFVGKFELGRAAVDDVASDIRNALGIGAPMRQRAKTQVAFITAISEAAESLGILVMRSGYVKNNNKRPIAVREFQGFALVDELAPVVFINANDFQTAQVFTLIHELVHIWIGQAGISNPSEGLSQTNTIEHFCNQVTAEVLVPAAEFPAAWRADSGDSRIQRLARRYWVSRFVIVRRAYELGLVDLKEFRRLRQGLVLPDGAEPAKKAKGGTFFSMAAIRAGHRLTDAVTMQASRGALVLRDAGRLLGMSQFAVAKISMPSARAS